ncbi:AMP-binding enzyme [Nonomuraea sp. SBT364]|uniref:AMP-binding enzyme n=1 Tax=Nonomuraea sp. SBT364 TaxID=1580530 RepID=UPI0009E939AA|nr:hypothetical protein [Nonomuraea sp. SBT364]
MTVEEELRRHPAVADCVVADVRTGVWETTLIAYVVPDGEVTGEELRAYLVGRLPGRRLPQVVALLRDLPRMPEGQVDRDALPLPVRARPAGGKGGGERMPRGAAMAVTALAAACAAFLLTDVLWPYSTDLSAVPQPWAALFTVLYLCECAAFGLGAGFLLFGRGIMMWLRRSARVSGWAHVAIVWLLVAWWPQDNFYRLAAKTDWPQQAALVYGFNVTLMIAAAVVVAFVAARPR